MICCLTRLEVSVISLVLTMEKDFNGHYTRKIYAHIYLDDHSLSPESFLKKMPVTSFTTEKRDINE